MTGARRVLIADDDPSIRHAVTLKLSKAGLDVTAASDGEEALKLALESEPELMIVDYAMPYMTGYDLCRELRKHERFDQTPVIVLTAMEQDIDTSLAAELGVVEFMTKPFSPRELLARTRELLESLPAPGGGAS
ncbi:MAG: response regulator transcription factor [Planctomycetota bacterium JB042]